MIVPASSYNGYGHNQRASLPNLERATWGFISQQAHSPRNFA